MNRHRRWLTGGVVLLLALLAGWGSAPPLAAQSPPARDGAYGEWLVQHLARQRAALRAVPTTLDLGNPAWRRDAVLALDAWGQLVQEARDQRPPPEAAALHAQLLQTLDAADRVRRRLLGAIAAAEPPTGDWSAELRATQDALAALAQRAGGDSGEARRPEPAQVTRGNLRITVLDLQRPYTARGAPADPAWEYLLVRLRLENLGGEPIRYDAFQFRLRSADETLQPPTPLQLPDELLWGSLDGNRLAGQIVGTIVYAVRKGTPPVALLYERQPGEAPVVIPLADAVSSQPAGQPSPQSPALPTPDAGATPGPS
ncbi:MAG: DUF4352 domain-containing protein [Chloroflexi bacterium]|nr:DUF4352 domain-containing protein [Chloroflexota bacterium]